MMKHENALLTVKEQAALLGISWRHLQNLTWKRLVPHLKLGKSVRYRHADVLRALEKLTIREVR